MPQPKSREETRRTARVAPTNGATDADKSQHGGLRDASDRHACDDSSRFRMQLSPFLQPCRLEPFVPELFDHSLHLVD